ncbi:MAG: cytochrome c biogenesis protein CcsA [Saprospiraceae bacterium]|nr:cytochrome c biogenesis protein CcsA [Saprospiraceae bacterium]
MKNHWWKALGVIILLYTFTAGMLLPLKPGIVAVNPSAVRTGDTVTLSVQGYNSFYTQSKTPVRAWLKLDEQRALAAKDIKILSDNALRVSFDIPAHLPVSRRVQDFTLLLDNDVDGASVLPSALLVTQDSIQPDRGEALWVNSPITDLHEKSGITFPFRNILAETIRNTYFHVALWFAMLFLFIGGVSSSVRYLAKNDLDADYRAQAQTTVGLIFGLLGLITGIIWARNTWGAGYKFWNLREVDVKQAMTMVALFVYLAYFVLRMAFEDAERKARLSAVYNIFAFVALIPLIYVVPRLTDSLHPGSGGNPALGGEDLDNTMRMIFYPAIIGWTLLGFWMAQLYYRLIKAQMHLEERVGG